MNKQRYSEIATATSVDLERLRSNLDRFNRLARQSDGACSVFAEMEAHIFHERILDMVATIEHGISAMHHGMGASCPVFGEKRGALYGR